MVVVHHVQLDTTHQALVLHHVSPVQQDIILLSALHHVQSVQLTIMLQALVPLRVPRASLVVIQARVLLSVM